MTKYISIHHPHLFSTPPHHFQEFPIHFLRCPKMIQEGLILLQETRIDIRKLFLSYLENHASIRRVVSRDMHMDDYNMLKKFNQIPVHTFQQIFFHHLELILFFLEIHASNGQLIYGELHKDDGNILKKLRSIHSIV